VHGSFADGGMIDDKQVEAGEARWAERRVSEGLERALLPGDGDFWMRLLKALRGRDHGEQAASVVPRDAGELNHRSACERGLDSGNCECFCGVVSTTN
jgi:hypothetical protein